MHAQALHNVLKAPVSRLNAVRSANGCVNFTVLMWKQISCKNRAAAAAAVEIPVLQRAPLACFMCVTMLYRTIAVIFQAIKHQSSTVAEQQHHMI